MTTTQHSLGAVLTAARRILAHNVSPAEVLRDVGVPAWYLAELERDCITRPNRDLLTLIYQAYELDAPTVQTFRQTRHFTTVLRNLASEREQATATFLRQQAFVWPDSAQFARQHGRLSHDPTVKNTYADLLRCARTQIDHDSVLAASVYYRLSPMAYWQMEADQLAVTDEVLTLLSYRLEVDDLTPFLVADNLGNLVYQRLAACQLTPSPRQIPGN